jgi:AraC-like DNA-binding protein
MGCVSRAATPVKAPTVFTTVGLPDLRRIELWENHNAAALIGLRCRTNGARALEATELNVALDRVQLARVAGSAHVVERTAGLIRHSPANAIAAYVTVRGDATFEHRDGTRLLRPGQVLMCDADQPFVRAFAQGLEELVVKVSRPAFAEITGRPSLPSPVVVDFARGTDPYARALAVLVNRAARVDGPEPADERTLLELVAVLAAGNEIDPSIAYLAAARSFIDGHLRDPRLRAAQVAAAIGISERHLSRIFAADGTSVPRYVLSRRLQLAHATLTGPASAGLTVTEVAMRCGFTSAAYFSQIFHEQFGERASEVRRRAQAAATH